MKILDPIRFCELCWPQVTLYDKQREIVYSVVENDETIVPAGNMLGKDFVAAFIAIWFFVSRHPCRVVTTSVDGTQLEGVLWGEIRRFIEESRYALPLVKNHLHLRKVVRGKVDGLSYLIGRVAAKGEGMLGHHIAKNGDGIPRTLFVADEASGVEDVCYERADTWADRKLIIGNPYPCNNFFFKGVKGGNQVAEGNGRLYRNVIRIRAEDSPNVRLAILQEKQGTQPSGEILVPGVLGYEDYRKRRSLWDRVRQCIGLDAEFYKGAEVLLYPPDWLNKAEQVARGLTPTQRAAKAIGVDTAQGGDHTAWAVVSQYGLVELVSKKTPDTSVITGETLALMRRYGVPAERVLFDAGGGGKEHADRLRSQGHDVRAVAFGAAATPQRRRGITPLGERKLEDERRYAYKNRRAEMYGVLRLLLDPSDGKLFGLPAEYAELRRQLSVMPLMYDDEGRLFLPPKQKRDAKDTRQTLTDLIGRSPDEADALVLATFGLQDKSTALKAGVAF